MLVFLYACVRLCVHVCVRLCLYMSVYVCVRVYVRFLIAQSLPNLACLRTFGVLRGCTIVLTREGVFTRRGSRHRAGGTRLNGLLLRAVGLT